MIKKLLFLLVFSLMIPNLSYADEIDVLCCSYHFKRNGQNEINPGFIYHYNLNDKNMLSTGVFQNSYDKTTFFAGYTRRWKINEDWSLSVTSGVRTGYPKKEHGFQWLAVIPSVEYKFIRVHLTPAFIGLGFKIAEW